jgi:hypothetical protein
VRHAEEVTEPQWTIFEGPERLQAEYRRLHGRMTDLVALELPITEEAIEELLESEGDWEPGSQLPASAVAPDVHAAITELLPDGSFAYFDADSGRGASGYAVALEVMGYVADAGGVLALGAMAFNRTRHLYERLRQRIGRRPLVSLGAAVHLAAADLVDRLGTDEFTLHGRGDARTGSPDASYSGDDRFWVIFERDLTLYVYIVDAYGRVTYLRDLRMRRMWDDDGRD